MFIFSLGELLEMNSDVWKVLEEGCLYVLFTSALGLG